MSKKRKLELLNTIEIDPYDYSEREYESPSRILKDSPDEWDNFWRKCISDKELGSLIAIEKGSYLVDITSIGDNELMQIVKNQLKDVDLEEYEEQVGQILGGIVVKTDDEFLIEPTCCGDIGNIREWESIFEAECNKWKTLWIGHPWIFYRRGNGIIELSDYSDSNFEDLKEVIILTQVLEKDLKHKLQKIKEQQIEFEKRIQLCLINLEIPNSSEIAKLLTGNE